MSDLVFNAAAELHPNGTPESVFVKANQKLKQDLRLAERRTRNWQRHAGVLALGLFVALGIAYRAYDKIEIFTFIVEIEGGKHVRNIGLLPQAYRGHAPAVIDTVVRGWLYNMRRVGIDPVVNEEIRHEAGAFMTMSAIRLSEVRYREIQDLEKKGWTTQIDAVSSLPMRPDGKVLQLEWTETTYTKQGTKQSEAHWRVIVNVVTYTEKDLPTDLQKRHDMRNKIGIFVEDYAWQPL